MAVRKDKSQEIENEIGKNPLITSDFKIQITILTDGTSYKYDGDILVPREVELEREVITKLYSGRDYRLLVMKLSPPAQRFFLWIAYELESGKDYIVVNRKRYMKENGVSSINTYKKSVADLSKETIIAYTCKRDVFWINPKYFFCGSRISKYPAHVEIYEPKKKER